MLTFLYSHVFTVLAGTYEQFSLNFGMLLFRENKVLDAVPGGKRISMISLAVLTCVPDAQTNDERTVLTLRFFLHTGSFTYGRAL